MKKFNLVLGAGVAFVLAGSAMAAVNQTEVPDGPCPQGALCIHNRTGYYTYNVAYQSTGSAYPTYVVLDPNYMAIQYNTYWPAQVGVSFQQLNQTLISPSSQFLTVSAMNKAVWQQGGDIVLTPSANDNKASGTTPMPIIKTIPRKK